MIAFLTIPTICFSDMVTTSIKLYLHRSYLAATWNSQETKSSARKIANYGHVAICHDEPCTWGCCEHTQAHP